jgi:hypothetical protein
MAMTDSEHQPKTSNRHTHISNNFHSFYANAGGVPARPTEIMSVEHEIIKNCIFP